MRYPFRRHFLICTGSRCNDEKLGKEGGAAIRDELKSLNKKLGRKPTVRVCTVSCLDLCDYGPNMIAYPEGTVYSGLDRSSAQKVYSIVMGDEEGSAEQWELDESAVK